MKSTAKRPTRRDPRQTPSNGGLIGRTISHYRILEKIGRGGMSVVYKARDLKLDRLVALKFLTAHLASSDEGVERFLREARAISAMNHPHIATIHDLGQEDGEIFLVLEYLPGGTLRSLIQDLSAAGSRLAQKQLLEFSIGIAAGLRHAHRRGIIHRDIKSDNILLAADGTPKITDFGLAKLRGSASVTHAGSIVGTLYYMSPEQARGAAVDQRSDIFSFGVVLYEMATGELPFRGPHEAATLSEIRNGSAPSVSRVRPDLPPEFGRIVRKALEKDPERRYQRLEEMIADLRSAGANLDSSLSEADSNVETCSLAAVSPHPSESSRGPLAARRPWILTTLLAALILTSAIILPASFSRIPPAWAWIRNAPAQKQLAVLPFNNISDDPAVQAFCDGLVESLTSKLARLERFHGTLRVVPASEARKNRVTSVGRARNIFGADLALSGSVQFTPETVFVTVNLVDARSLVQLRTWTREVGTEEIVSLREGVLRAVAGMLQLELEPKEKKVLAGGESERPDAYDLYLKGREYVQRYEKVENIDRAIGLFEEALKRDPGYGLALAGLGEAYWRKYKVSRDARWIEPAGESCRRAIELNPSLAPVHFTLGLIHSGTGRHEEAVREFEKTLSLDPLNAGACREMARAFESMARYEEAEAAYWKAIGFRPGFWAGYNALGAFYAHRGRYVDAEKQFRKAIELAPDNALVYSNLGGLYVMMGRYREGAEALERSLLINPTPNAYSNLGTEYYYQGRYAEAARLMEKAVELRPEDYQLWGNLADVYNQIPARAQEATAAYQRAVELAKAQLAVNSSDSSVRASVAGYWARLGSCANAIEEIREAVKLAPENVSVRFRAALVYEPCRRRDKALSMLRGALEKGYPASNLRRHPELARLRADSRYHSLPGVTGNGPTTR